MDNNIKTPYTMKRIILLLLACLPLLAQAQTYDTISGPNGRVSKYHYTSWFDTCGVWNDTQTRHAYGHPEVPGNLYVGFYGIEEWSRNNPFGGSAVAPPESFAKAEYVPRGSVLKGVAVFTTPHRGDPYYWYDVHPVTVATSPDLAPDTCFVFDVVNGEMDILAYARWDTATPKIYKMPWHEDSVHAGYGYFKMYEVYFKTPFEVPDTFYLTATPYNQEVDGFEGYWVHPPHHYAQIRGRWLEDDPCVPPNHEEWYRQQNMNPTGYNVVWGGNKPTLTRRRVAPMEWGGFFPILSHDSVKLNTRSADLEMGFVVPGSRKVLQWVTHTITAHPRTGYKFTHWNDGNTENPRRVLMDKDSTFTAYFAPKEQYHVAVSVDDPEQGYATGSGTYYELDTVRMEAFPSSDCYRFNFWGDGNVSNPRYHIVTGDTAFIAFFRDLSGIDEAEGGDNLFTLTPNPATGSATLTIARPGQRHELVVHNAAGHEVMYKVIPAVQASVDLDLSRLPAGAYFVTLATPTATGTQRLVVR